MSEVFKVTIDAAVPMLKACGFATADTMEPERLERRLNKIRETVKGEQEEMFDEKSDEFKLYKQVRVALEKGQRIKVIGSVAENTTEEPAETPAKKVKPTNGVAKPKKADPAPEPEPAPEPPAKPKKDKKSPKKQEPEEKSAKKKAKTETVEQATPKKKTAPQTPAAKKPKADDDKGPKADDGKGPKVIATIIERIKKASKKNPVTEPEINEYLAEKIPGREKAAMAKTLRGQLAYFLRKAGHPLVKTPEKGYYFGS